jgi:CheY-like chemotaxis protein
VAKILIVDDNHLIRRTVRAILGSARHEVHEAGSGLEALELARTLHPDLMVLDYMMPGLDGVEVLRRVGQVPGLDALPVLMLTAKTEGVDLVEAGLGARRIRFVTKPIKSAELLGLVQELLAVGSRLEGPAPPDTLSDRQGERADAGHADRSRQKLGPA